MAQWRDVRMISVQFKLCSQLSRANDTRGPIPEIGCCLRRVGRTEARQSRERLVGVHRRGRSLPKKRIRRLHGGKAGGHDVGVEEGYGDRTCLKEPMTGLLCGAIILGVLWSLPVCLPWPAHDREKGMKT